MAVIEGTLDKRDSTIKDSKGAWKAINIAAVLASGLTATLYHFYQVLHP